MWSAIIFLFACFGNQTSAKDYSDVPGPRRWVLLPRNSGFWVTWATQNGFRSIQNVLFGMEFAHGVSLKFGLFYPEAVLLRKKRSCDNEIDFEMKRQCKNNDLSIRQEIYNEHLKKSREDREVVYKDLKSMLRRMGLPGKPCLARLICESGASKSKELIDQLQRILFSPSLAYDGFFTGSEYDFYVQAERNGKKGHDCRQIYGQCNPQQFVIQRKPYLNQG